MVLDLIFGNFFLYQGFDWGKNVVVFVVDNSLSVHIDNAKKVS